MRAGFARSLTVFGGDTGGYGSSSVITTIITMDNLISTFLGAAVVRQSQTKWTSAANLSLHVRLENRTDAWPNLVHRTVVFPPRSTLEMDDAVRLCDRDVIKGAVYLAQLDAETNAHLGLSVGLRVVELLGWMVDSLLKAPPELHGEQRSGHCLPQVAVDRI
ncbi:hypothetical protein MRX96_029787 [Rhipicephalus microplus]